MSKASKLRLCPALGRTIPSRECGESRHGRLACPADCPFDPFAPANYNELLAIEDALDRKTIEWLSHDSRDSAAAQQEIGGILTDRLAHAQHAGMARKLFFERDAAGLTCAQRWERQGFPGLRNDEPLLFRGKRQMQVAVLEIRRVLDDRFVEAVDLLAPERGPLRIVDLSLAARATRFSTLIGWVYPLPHFWRMAGTAIHVPAMDTVSPEKVVRETLHHLGAPTEGEARNLWMVENFLRIDASILATSQERHRRMLGAIDAHQCSASYELTQSPEELRKALKASSEAVGSDLSEEEAASYQEAWDWLDDTQSENPLGNAAGRQLLGHLVLGAKTCRIEAMGKARYEKLRKRFEAQVAGLVRFTAERRVDTGAQLAMKKAPPADPSLVPPKLLENPTQFELTTMRIDDRAHGESDADIKNRTMQSFYRQWLTASIQSLGGRTPRQAAGDPTLRPTLVEMVKHVVQGVDRENLQSGRSTDINWLIRELGLTEIDFPPPPPRVLSEPCVRREDLDDEWGVDEEAPPPPPAGVLSFVEAKARLQVALDRFETAKDALNELEANGSGLITDASALVADVLDDEKFSMLVSYLLQAWFSLVPEGDPAPQLNYVRMETEFDQGQETLLENAARGTALAMDWLIGGCRQPAVLQLLFLQLIEGSPKLPKKYRPDLEEQMAMIRAIRAVVNEIDRVQRG